MRGTSTLSIMNNCRFCLAVLIVFLNITFIGAQTEASASNAAEPSATPYLPDCNASFNNLSEYLSQHLTYTKLAKENCLEGTVKAEVLINETGKVAEVRIVKSMGNILDAQVIQLLREMPHWTPAARNGSAIPQRIIVPVTFSLR